MDKPKSLRDYVLTLRKFNPGVSDADISTYLSSIGYSPEEIAREFVVDEPRLESGFHIGINEGVVDNANSESNVQNNIQEKIKKVDGDVEVKNLSTYPLIPKDIKKINISSLVEPIGEYKYSGQKNINNSGIESIQKSNKKDIYSNTVQKIDTSNLVNTDIQKSKPGKLKYMIGVLFFVLAVFCYVYFIHGKYIFVRPPLSGDSLKSQTILQLFNNKLSFTGEFTYDVNTKKREISNLKKFTEELDNFDADEVTLQNIAIVHSKILDFEQKNKKLPDSLDKINFTGSNFQIDKFGFGTTTNSGKEDFFVSVPLLTNAGVNVAIQSGAENTNNNVIRFLGSNPPPFYPKPVTSLLLSKFDFLKSEKDFADLFKDNSNFKISVIGDFDGNDGEFISYSDIGLSFSSEDFNLDTKFELINDNEENFVRLKEFPKSILDVSNIKESWINLKDDNRVFNLKDLLPDFVLSFIDNGKKINEFVDTAIVFLKKSDDYGLLKFVGEPERIKVDGKSLFKYEVEIDKDVLLRIMNEVFSDGTKGLDLEINSLAFNDLVGFINQNKKLYVSVDASGNLKNISVHSSLYPETTQPADTLGVDIDFELYLDKSVKEIKKPETPITLKDVYKKISGFTDNEFDLLLQIKTIEEIRKSLNIYYRLTGSYPDSLSKLIIPVTDLATSTNSKTSSLGKDNVVVGSSEYYLAMFGNKPILDYIPRSIYKDDQFVYIQKNKDFYNLQYKIEPVAFSKKVSEILVDEVLVKSGKKIKHLMIREGNNTATEQNISDESARSIIDSDSDGLSDILESFIGTDPKLKDTDKDGVSDYDYFLNIVK